MIKNIMIVDKGDVTPGKSFNYLNKLLRNYLVEFSRRRNYRNNYKER